MLRALPAFPLDLPNGATLSVGCVTMTVGGVSTVLIAVAGVADELMLAAERERGVSPRQRFAVPPEPLPLAPLVDRLSGVAAGATTETERIGWVCMCMWECLACALILADCTFRFVGVIVE